MVTYKELKKKLKHLERYKGLSKRKKMTRLAQILSRKEGLLSKETISSLAHTLARYHGSKWRWNIKDTHHPEAVATMYARSYEPSDLKKAIKIYEKELKEIEWVKKEYKSKSSDEKGLREANQYFYNLFYHPEEESRIKEKLSKTKKKLSEIEKKKKEGKLEEIVGVVLIILSICFLVTPNITGFVVYGPNNILSSSQISMVVLIIGLFLVLRKSLKKKK